MSKVQKAVIPVGGYGTRFLPATKSQGKEMFPVGRKPVVLHVVEELVSAGIRDIIFVVGHNKHPIEDFFTPNTMQEDFLISLGKKDKVKEIKQIAKLANFTFVYSAHPNGNGAAIKSVQHLVKDEPFLLVWGDEFFINGKQHRIKNLIDAYDKYEKPVISCVKITDESQRQHYGIAELSPYNGERKIKSIESIVEKPKPGTEPSVYAAHSAYILTPEIFKSLNYVSNGRGTELFLVDLINDMKTRTGLLGCIIDDGTYLDCGNPRDYLYSQIIYGLKEGEHKKELKQFLKKITSKK